MRVNLRSHSDADVARVGSVWQTRKDLPAIRQDSAPSTTVFTDVQDVLFDSTIRYDDSFYQGLDRIVQSEPWLDRDRAMIDQLKTLGIEKGKPFTPDEATRKALTAGIQEAHAYLAAKYDAGLPPFFDGTHWSFPAPPDLIKDAQAGFTNPDTYPIDSRGLAYTTPISASNAWGPGSSISSTSRTRTAENYDGSKTYRLHVPPDVPIEQYWSLTAYDRETHALIKNVDRASRASNNTEVKKNADGSVDLYVGPTAPDGTGIELDSDRL